MTLQPMIVILSLIALTVVTGVVFVFLRLNRYGTEVGASQAETRLRTLAAVCSALVGLIGLLVLATWIFGGGEWSGLGAGVPVAPSTATWFLLLSLVILLQVFVPSNTAVSRFGLVIDLAGVLVLAVLFILSSRGIYLDIEHMGLQIEHVPGATVVGHVSPITAFSLFIVAVSSLVLFNFPDKWRSLNLPWWLSVMLTMTGLAVLLAYLFDVPVLYGTAFVPPAALTSFALVLLGLSLMSLAFPLGWVDRLQDSIDFRGGRTYFLIFILFSSGIIAVGQISFSNYSEQLREQEGIRLQAVANLKVQELDYWRKERLLDANMLHENRYFAGLVQSYFDNRRDYETRNDIQQWLSQYRMVSEYDQIMLLDAQGRVVLQQQPGPHDDTDAGADRYLAEAQKELQPILIDFHRREIDGEIRLSLLIPILDGLSHSELIGIVIVSIDPQVYLYPLIKEWPSNDQTAEALIVRREGSDVLYLNELRLQENTALNLRFPLIHEDLLAVKAVLGQSGVVEGVDYLGNPALGAVMPVPDSPWFLVARKNSSEVDAVIKQRLWQTVGLMGLVIMLGGAGLVTFWRQQRLTYYRQQLEAAGAAREREKQLAELQVISRTGSYRLNIKTGYWESSAVLDKIFGIDVDYDHSVSGWTDLVFPSDRQSMAEYLQNDVIAQHGRFDREYRIVRHNDRVLRWVSGVGELEFDDQGQPVALLGTIQDITESKAAEDSLRRLNASLTESQAKYYNLFNTMQDMFWVCELVHDDDGTPVDIIYLDSNPAHAARLRLTREEIIGSRHLDLFPRSDTFEAWLVHFDRIIKEGVAVEFEQAGSLSGAVYKVSAFSPLPGQCAVIMSDITERKRAEAELKRQNQYLTALQQTALDLISQFDLDSLLEKIARRAAELMGTDSGYIDLVDVETGSLVPKVGFGMLDESISYKVQPGEGVAGMVWQSGQPLIVNQYDQWDRRVTVYTLHKIGAVLGVPLLSGSEVIGVLGLAHSVESGRQFEEDSVEVLNQFARLSTLAIENARLFNQSKQELAARRLVEEALRETNAYLENLLNYANAPIIVWDTQFKITRFNRAFEQLTGRQESEMLGAPLEALFPQGQVESSMDLIRRTQSGERWETVEIQILHVDGSIRTVLWNSATLFEADGVTPLATIAQGQDITDRKRSERMIESRLQLIDYAADHSLEDLLRKTLDLASEMTGSTIGFYHSFNSDQNTIFLQAWSTRTEREYCKAEGKGSHYPLDSAGVWADSARLKQPIIHNDYASLEGRRGLPEGHAELLREMVAPVIREDRVVAILGLGNKPRVYTAADMEVLQYFADISWEITERKRAEEQLANYAEHLAVEVNERTRELRDAQDQLVRQEKLATLGQLAGSIGHELRNPLGVILNAVYFLKLAQPDATDKVREYLSIIENEARASDKIVTDLLDFTRLKSLDREAVHVQEIIRETFERFPVPPTVDMDIQIPDDLPRVFVDSQQMVQVLRNLTVNACQAMTSKMITNLTSLGIPSRGLLTITASLQDGGVLLSVRDTGVGIPPENLSKLFEPLFTTKTKGIGLGLAVSKKLIEANGGRIEVHSMAGEGSTFKVWLPLKD